MTEQKDFGVTKWIDDAAYRGAYIGGWMSMLLMALVFVDVLGRGLFKIPVPSLYETSEAIIIPALVYISMAKGFHISVDMVINKFSGKHRFAMEIFRHLISVLCVAMLSWGSVMAAKRAYEMDLTSEALISWPIWPAYWIVAGGMVMLLFVRIILLRKAFHKYR